MTDEALRTIAEIVENAEPVDIAPTGDGGGPRTPGGGDRGGGGGEPPERVPDPVDWELVRRCAAEPETDIGNARRFLHRYRNDVISVMRIGFHVYDGRRWAEDVEGASIRPLAHRTVEEIRLEATLVEPTEEEQAAIAAAEEVMPRYTRLKKLGRQRTPEEELELLRLGEIVGLGAEAAKAISERRARRVRYAKTSASSGKIDNMLKEAAVYVAKSVSELDADPLAINCHNGTLRLVRQGEGKQAIWTVRLDPHRREDLISKLIPVAYDDAAECPNFLRFIETVLPDDEVRAFMQRYLGYALTALTGEQVFVFLYGQGRNGKSTLVDLICRLLGDYAASVPFETLAGEDRRKGSEATPELARLPGTRLVRASEPEQSMQFREAMVKSLTSGEPILVRHLHRDFVEVYPTFKLVVSGNHKPTIKGTDDGIWRRVLLVPFLVQIPKEDIDRALPDKLWAERAGILNWLIAGALSYLQEGLGIPEAVRAATDEYREESDPVSAWVREACIVTGEDTDVMTPGEAHASFKVFCERAGFNAWGPTTFNRNLPLKAAAFGFRKAKSMGMSLYRGLRIKDEYRPPSHTHGGDSEG